MVADRTVVLACAHAAILEICAQTRTDMGLFVLASRIVPCQSEPLGKPRLTLVSDGNPLRRLLLRSKKNSVFTAVSPFGWICPSHPEGEAAFAIVAYLDVVVESDYSLASLRWIVVEKSPLHSMTPKKANKQRKVVRMPGFASYAQEGTQVTGNHVRTCLRSVYEPEDSWDHFCCGSEHRSSWCSSAAGRTSRAFSHACLLILSGLLVPRTFCVPLALGRTAITVRR